MAIEVRELSREDFHFSDEFVIIDTVTGTTVGGQMFHGEGIDAERMEDFVQEFDVRRMDDEEVRDAFRAFSIREV